MVDSEQMERISFERGGLRWGKGIGIGGIRVTDCEGMMI